MAKGLTSKQERILHFVIDYVKREGYPPSIREIGSHFNIGSLRGVTVHLDALARKGYIARSNTPRSIKVIRPETPGGGERFVMLPLVGSIAAGQPISAVEDIEGYLPVPSDMVRNVENPFLLRVRGESMIGDGILPRDIVVIKPQQTALQNELVAVMIDDEATIKRFHRDSDGIKLMPSNPAFEPIPVTSENAFVIGKVVGLIRDYTGSAF